MIIDAFTISAAVVALIISTTVIMLMRSHSTENSQDEC